MDCRDCIHYQWDCGQPEIEIIPASDCIDFMRAKKPRELKKEEE